MQRIFILFTLCLFAGIVVSQDHNGFIGTWIDNFGLTYKLCITEGQTRLEGAYNNFGIIQADLTDFSESATGNFYETYYQTDNECPRGDFNWHINGDTITGDYTCFDSLSGGEWTLTRVIPDDRPSHSECYVLLDSADDNDIEGAWNYNFADDDDEWDICIDGDDFFASYGEQGAVGSTYQFGKVFEGNRVLSGSYITIIDSYGNIQTGGSLIMLTEKTDLSSFNWVSPNTLSQVLTASSGSHFVTSDVEKVGNTEFRACERNADLSVGYDDDDDYYLSEDSSSANILSVGFACIVGIFALF